MQLETDPPLMQSPPGPYTVIDGRRYLYFAGTGYLGLQGHPSLIEAACHAARRYGIHSGTSRAGFGNQEPTIAVERSAAELLSAEAAFYFISGYVGNHILAGALAGQFDAVLLDASAHYSVQEAARLTALPVFPFAARDPDDLGRQLAGNVQAGQRALLMCDGVSPVTGRIAPLLDYQSSLAPFPGSAICVDDAHGLGVLGANGRGTLEHLGISPEHINRALDPSLAHDVRWFACTTLSKAIGGSGGVIAGSDSFISQLKQQSHYYSGATPPAAPVAAATAEGLRIVRQQPGLRLQLRENANYLRARLRQRGLPIEELPTPIICLELDSAERMQAVQQELMRQGIVIAYFRSYSGIGPLGALRIAVFANHTREMLDQLVDSLTAAL
jgi:glycine C-acetyltransferase/8-amino-7-oxononanoate synthase